MKALFSTVILLVSVNASAVNVCDKFFTCGTFEGDGSYSDTKGNVLDSYREKTAFKSSGDNQGVIEMTISEKNGVQGASYNLDVKFEDDGRFTITSKGRLYAQGICKDMVCTYGMIPFKSNDQLIGNSGILRFSKNKVERLMLVLSPDDTINQLSVLNQK